MTNVKTIRLAGASLRLAAIALAIWAYGTAAASAAEARFTVSFDAALRGEPLTGRLLVVVTDKAGAEPREQIGMHGAPIFGIDLNGLKPGESASLDAAAVGYPVPSIARLPAGDYYVQAVVETYRQVHRADGHTIWAVSHPGQGVPFAFPGNLYSAPVKVHLDPAAGFDVRLKLSQTIPESRKPDTTWIKRVRIKSEILSRFWGMPIYLGANVLLPKGYAEHPDAHYPIVYLQSFSADPFFISDKPGPSPDDDALRDGNLQTGYEFFQSWTSDKFPRILAATVEQPCPYFVEAYSVDSANCGPYGEALTKELFPYLEKKFRAIGKPYARFVEGASTGGWESLALQLKYPDYFGGTWTFNPDPISFRHYQLIDIYKDDNAFEVPLSSWVHAERPMKRTVEGQVLMTIRELSALEATLGDKGRSGFQLECWEAMYGPVGEDGYPKPLWDKATGLIDHSVAAYMRDHGYDLTDYTERNWATLGPKLRGKLNIISGDMDWFYLNNAVYDFQAMIEKMGGPDYPARFVFGRPKKGHNWHHKDWAGVVQEMAAQALSNAPAGENTAQWRY